MSLLRKTLKFGWIFNEITHESSKLNVNEWHELYKQHCLLH